MKIKVVKRDNEINSMLEIIRNIDTYKENSQNGLVILLNGAWGTGKTTYLNELKKSIDKVDDMKLFNYYNAYEYDCYDNAYIPLFASIAQQIKLDNDKITSIVKSTGLGLITGVSSAGKAVLNKFTGIDLNTVKDDIKSSIKYFDTNVLEDFEKFKESKNYIKSNLKKVCEDSIHVFIIDELDRCKPSFAMDTLEIVKHFFDVPNCVFIIAVDKLQLEQSANVIYGAIDSEKYFSKLFDYQFNLLPISIKDAVDLYGYGEFMTYVAEVFDILKTSVRDGKKILNDFFVKCGDWNIRQKLFMLLFFILKYTDLSFYNAILNGEFKKYSKLIRSEYDSNLEKYVKVLEHDIGSELKYGVLLEFFSNNMNKRYFDLTCGNFNDTTVLDYGNYNTCELVDVLKEHIPNVNLSLSMKDNVRNMVG